MFGSQARGDARIDSDWDILIILDKEKLEPEDYDKVRGIEISQYDDKTGDLGAILNVTDENQIREILEALYITDNSEIFNISTINYQIEVQIDWKSEAFNNTDGFCSCYFRTDEVPEFVTKELEE